MLKFFRKIVERIGYIPLFYWNFDFSGKNNVGDLFSLLVVRSLSKFPVKYAYDYLPFKFYAIGSVVNNVRLRVCGLYWGSGMLAHSVYKHFLPSEFLAVRGPLTRRSLLDAGYRCPDVYGDPALLLPQIYRPSLQKKYKIGIICHWRHQNYVKCDAGIKLINILRSENDAWNFIDEIYQCEMILSSSLHGIIIANAYGIPARQFIFENSPLEGDPLKKFHDYYLSVHMPVQTPLVFRRGIIINEHTRIKFDKTVDLKINLDLLKETFPFR